MVSGPVDDDHDASAEKCYLCQRSRPVYAGDEQLKRLPDRSLNAFLRRLKQDVISNQLYIRMVRLTPKLIKACHCENLLQHSYCVTVKVL